MTLQLGILFLALVSLSVALVCPDGGMCEDKNTCCKNTEGGYGCCPLPHLSERVKAVICPDQMSECPDGTTCCQLPDSSWGCCPLANAVCCEDKRHCCPERTKCDLVHSRCVSASLEIFPMIKKLSARMREKKSASGVSSVTCPGGKSSCPDSYTCYLLTTGDYGCCPYPEATCCGDHVHCCPSNTICDLDHGVCKSGETRSPLLKNIPAVPNDVVCPDKKSVCPDETTCCKMVNGSYGCCPMPNAVCCSDHIHCCPEGTQCDLSHSTCVSTPGDTTMAMKIPEIETQLVTIQNKVQAVPCNDSVACADGSTCCKSPKGEWACCPLPKAVCCEDHLHCCPHGTICNLAASTCDNPIGGALMPWLDKVPTVPLLTDNKCDESTSCPGTSTCCKIPGGAWGCCPLPEAVCCDDHLHCCPHSKVCNLKAETCDDPSGFSFPVPWVAKVSALTLEIQDEKCDQQTMCPGGTTCCRRNSGQWACCPLPQAVCCNDHEHCCPKGYKCNVAEQTCDRPGDLSLPWLQKLPALQRELNQAEFSPHQPSENMCDAQTRCPKDTTCCFMENTHKWGCCPLPKAVCCKDGNHCCPSGHTCEPHRSTCSKGPHVIPWFTKVSALMEPSAVTDVKCDDKSSCASGTTCCKLPKGDWGCCPLVKAVCCADHEHCCPHDYTCNMQTGTCEKKILNVLFHDLPQSRVGPSELRETKEEKSEEFRCSKRETCCKISANEWACCPLPRAICCPDSKHCCPVGYSCDLKAGGCSLQTQLIWDSLFGDRNQDFVPYGDNDLKVLQATADVVCRQ
ncbi:hypothetical protein Q5P01_023053 [Channa striata]|uniref:Granulins domain-containing protein n=1 Tax=Channa striata TaxID=64152 RepID=A0AA88ISN2_CHASR|nr:hypothetical protein Q5P01_023053 [Channa striata]